MKQINTPFSLLSLPKKALRKSAKERTKDGAQLSKKLAAPGETIDFRKKRLISQKKS